MRLLLFAAVAALALPRAASANTWSMTGAGCTIDPATASLAEYNYGGVQFATGQTGTIKVICPIIGPTTSDPTDVYATYYDTDGTSTSCTVQQSLYEATTNVGGDSPTISFILDQWDDTQTGHLPTNSSPYKNLGHDTLEYYFVWDWTTYYFWFEVDLTRSSTSCQVSLQGVALNQ
jgi:hypothetical protein